MRVSRLTTLPPAPNNRSRDKTTSARSAVPSPRISYGFSLPSNTSMKMRASPTARPALRGELRERVKLGLAGRAVGDARIFSSLEYVHENASIAYSPSSQTEFNALAQLASQGLISTPVGAVNSMAVPSSVPVPFRDYLATARLDWAQSAGSEWFLRAAGDNYITRNA